MKRVQQTIVYITIGVLLCIAISCQQAENTMVNTTTEKKQSYAEKRKELIAKDSLRAFAAEITLSDKELKLDSIIDSYRTTFNTSISNANTSFYNQPFHTVQHMIDTTMLYTLFQKMPKGGLLHTHSIGMTNIKWVIDYAEKLSNCYVYEKESNDTYLYGQLGIYKEDNIPDGFVSLQAKLQQIPSFRDTLYELMQLKRKKLSDTMDYWTVFEERFKRIAQVLNYRPFFKAYYKQAFVELIQDQITHVEIRMIFDHLFDSTTVEYPIETMILDLEEVVKEIQMLDERFSISIIYTSFKFLDNKNIDKQIQQAFYLKQKYPDIISGFDLVSEEDKGHSVLYYQKNWKTIDSLEQKLGIELPLFLHAGESKSRKNQNLIDAVLLDSKRIGHGLNLILYPEIMSLVKKKDILIEVCPLSNQILGYANDLRNHPARILLANGIPCSINNDDSGVFAYQGLSYDFVMACLAWELTLKEIKKLIQNSITYSGLTAEKKEAALVQLDIDWNVFVKEQIGILEKTNSN
ncbi:adenosine kinase [Aquimarina aquimarini]|uniref:adenosine kinase n=1 Tax=Aquimarina aquimarini TaxID=1191734 RepID=UPI00131F460F|nr:adenosine kinase [Aquimarina aquimarini]